MIQWLSDAIEAAIRGDRPRSVHLLQARGVCGPGAGGSRPGEGGTGAAGGSCRGELLSEQRAARSCWRSGAESGYEYEAEQTARKAGNGAPQATPRGGSWAEAAPESGSGAARRKQARGSWRVLRPCGGSGCWRAENRALQKEGGRGHWMKVASHCSANLSHRAYAGTGQRLRRS